MSTGSGAPEEAAENPWFCRTGTVTAPIRLFYFPYAGGNASAILPWQDELGSSVELLVAQPPGRGRRLFEDPVSELDVLAGELARAVAELADRPFAFFGHSLGALIAFEVTRELRRQGQVMPASLWVSGAEGPQTRALTRQLHRLPDAELIGALRDYRGTPAELLDEPEMMALLLPGIRADVTLSERYRYRAEAPLELPVHVLCGDQDPFVTADRAAGWALETSRPVRDYRFAGDHFFIEPHRAEIAGLVVAELSGDRANPYRALPARSFWRTAVAEPGLAGLDQLWQPKFELGQDEPILTAGSCFARHIGPALLAAGLNWYDAELPPPGLTATERASRHYREFSFRTGNIYTAAMLRQWLSWAVGESSPPAGVWAEGSRWLDAYRPSIEPAGYPSAGAVQQARAHSLAAIRDALARAGCLVFTLGLTEAWYDRTDGSVYPVCPGTVRGRFDADRHVFGNAGFAEVYRDLAAAVALARTDNPSLRVVLTVSPVPLTATATGQHVLVATSYSKSVLRAVAGQLAGEDELVDYFPSYELVTGSPARASLFEPNLRTVTADGVALVMRHFLAGLGTAGTGTAGLGTGGSGTAGMGTAGSGTAGSGTAGSGGRPAPATDGGDPYCDDAVLDYYRGS